MAELAPSAKTSAKPSEGGTQPQGQQTDPQQARPESKAKLPGAPPRPEIRYVPVPVSPWGWGWGYDGWDFYGPPNPDALKELPKALEGLKKAAEEFRKNPRGKPKPGEAKMPELPKIPLPKVDPRDPRVPYWQPYPPDPETAKSIMQSMRDLRQSLEKMREAAKAKPGASPQEKNPLRNSKPQPVAPAKEEHEHR